MAKHFTSALAVLKSATANREKFLNSFAKYKQDAITESTNSPSRYILVDGDVRALARFKKVLDAQGITYVQGTEPFTQKLDSYITGESTTVRASARAISIDLAQPRGHLARVMLEKGQDFEADFTERQLKIRDGLRDKEQYPGRDGIEFYDITGWSIPLAWGIDAYTSKTPPNVEYNTVVFLRPGNAGGKVGWQISYTDQEDAIAAIELLQAGVRVHVSTKPMTVGETTIGQGTFFVFRDRNDADIDEKVSSILKKHGCTSVPLNSSFPSTGVVGPGSDSVVGIAKPNIAIVFGDQPNTTRFGSSWYLFDKVFNLPFTAISQRALAGDLSKYTATILPGGARPTAQLKTWIQQGGVAIALGGSSFIGTDYIDLKQSKLKDDKDPTDLPGAIFRASLNPRSPLAYGYDTTKPIAVPVAGSTFYKRKEEGGGVVLLGDEPTALSGWTWPDEGDALKDTVWLHDEPIGGGHLVWFSFDPTDRAMWPGTYKMLLNAILIGR
jgi:hypothetical protein